MIPIQGWIEIMIPIPKIFIWDNIIIGIREKAEKLKKIFYVMKVVGKIHLGIYFIGGIVNFTSTQFWNFPISGSWDIGDLKNIDIFGNFANFAPKSKVKISKIGPNCSLRLQQL
jgi:hypothetical protein